jgi:hypothetical protein
MFEKVSKISKVEFYIERVELFFRCLCSIGKGGGEGGGGRGGRGVGLCIASLSPILCVYSSLTLFYF